MATDEEKDGHSPASTSSAATLAHQLLELLERSGYFSTDNVADAVQRLQDERERQRHGEQQQPDQQQQVDPLDNLLSPFLLLAAAEKIHHLAPDLRVGCEAPLPMYEEVRQDVATLVHLFRPPQTASATSPHQRQAPNVQTSFMALLEAMLRVVEARLSLCRWYGSHTTHAQAVEKKQQHPVQSLEAHIRHLGAASITATAAAPWRDAVLLETRVVAASLEALALVNRGPSTDVLAVVLQLLRFRKALGRWDALATHAGEKEIDASRRRLLHRQCTHLVNKLPLRFHAVAGQTMDLPTYYHDLLGWLPYAAAPSPSSSLSASPRPREGNPYVDLFARFVLSYGSTAQVCVAILRKAPTTKQHAYVVPRSTTRPLTSREGPDDYVPVFSLTSVQVAMGGVQLPPTHARHLSGSSSADTLVGRPASTSSSVGGGDNRGSMGTPASSSSVAQSAKATTPKSKAHHLHHHHHSQRHVQAPPAWFWDHYDSSVFPAMQGQVPEGGAQRFSLLGGEDRTDRLEGTFVHHSGSRWRGRQVTFAYFVAHLSRDEHLVIVFNDRSRPPTDRVVLQFLMSATAVLQDSMVYAD